jgi:chromosomal replication initiator protein
MALSVLLTEHSFPRIGYYFGGRDSTTVRHAWKVVHRRRQSDPKLHDALCKLTLELVRH